MRISVIIPNYNYAQFIGPCIDSVLNQSEPAHEIIVVDDGSTDHSHQVISAYGDKIIAIFQENAGQAAAISHGFSRATGDIIALLDSDDVFAFGKIRLIKELYANHPEIGWLFHALEPVTFDEVNAYLEHSKQLTGTRPYPVDQRERMRKDGKSDYISPATSGLTFKRSLGEAIFPLPKATSIYISDHYIKYYCLAVSPGMDCGVALGAQVIHGSNLYTGKKSDATKARIFINTAVELQKTAPVAREFCHNLFVVGFAAACKNGMLREMGKRIREYAASVKGREWPLMTLKILNQFLGR